MNSTKSSSKNRDMKRFAKRLTSYSAAAGLGAFACGEAADAAIVYTDLNPDVMVSNGSDNYFDIDGDGVDDFRFRHSTFGASAASIRNVVSDGASYNMSSTADGGNSTYYIRGFDFGETVLAPADSGGNVVKVTNAAGIMKSDAPFNFAEPNTYLGFSLDIGGNQHFGWARVFIEDDPNSPGALKSTWYEHAYENTPGASINAGQVPEPSSLALLAAGAGALGLRRRRTT